MSLNKIVRLFVSSTFEDFRAERTALQSYVFPTLRAHCESAGFQFQAVDLRWGVSEAASREHRTVDICLEEIRVCQKMSPRPNFMVLLGQRCGWHPVLSRIPQDEYQRLMQAALAPEKKLIDDWYRLDNNAVPPQRVLRSPSENEIFPETEVRQILLPAAVRIGLPQERLDYYSLSATGLEILRGALDESSAPDAEQHVHVFSRTIRNLPASSGVYRDLTQERANVNAATQLGELVDRLRRRLSSNNHWQYEESWTGDQDPERENPEITHEKLDAFCNEVLRRLRLTIDGQIAQFHGRSDAERENSAHAEFAAGRRNNFCGRKEEIMAFSRFVSSDSAESASILLIHGPSGCGKSAFVAEAASRHEGAACVRYVGITPSSSDATDLLYGMYRELGATDEPPESSRDIGERIAELLAKKPCLIVVDAVDQLGEGDLVRFLQSLPSDVPSGSKMVITCTDEKLSQVKGELGKCQLLPISALSAKHAGRLLDAWLDEDEDNRRTLSFEQRRAILEGFVAAGHLPLYLRLAASLAKQWESWSKIHHLPDTLQGLINSFFDRLHSERGHGKLFVESSLSFIAAMRNGLAEEELIDVLGREADVIAEYRRDHPKSPPIDGLPPILWSRLKHDLQAFLVTREAQGKHVMTFFHRQFQVAIEGRWLADDKGKKVHGRLVAYFKPQSNYLDVPRHQPNARKTANLVWHLARAGMNEHVSAVLQDFDFVMAKCLANQIEDLVGDYRGISPSAFGAMNLWRSFVLSHANRLRRGSKPWPSNRILLQLALEHADESPLMVAAEAWIREGRCDWPVLTRAARPQKPEAANGRVVLELHEHGVVGLLQLRDGRLLSWDSGGFIALWNDDIGAFLPNKHFWKVQGAVEVGPGRVASWSSSELMVWDVDRPHLLACERIHRQPIEGIITIDEQMFATWANEALIYLWNVADGKLLSVLEGHEDRVTMLLYRGDGRIISGSMDGTLRVWKSTGGDCLRVVASGSRIAGGTLCPDGSILTWSGSKVTLWSPTVANPRTFDTAEGYYSEDESKYDVVGAMMVTSSHWIVTWSESPWQSLKLWNAQSLELSGIGRLMDGDRALGVHEVPLPLTGGRSERMRLDPTAQRNETATRGKERQERQRNLKLENEAKRSRSELAGLADRACLWVRGRYHAFLFLLPQSPESANEEDDSDYLPFWNFSRFGAGVGKTRCANIKGLVVLRSDLVITCAPTGTILWRAGASVPMEAIILSSGDSSGTSGNKGVLALDKNRCALWDGGGSIVLLELNDLSNDEDVDLHRTWHGASTHPPQVTSAALLENGTCLALYHDGKLENISLADQQIISSAQTERSRIGEIKGARLIGDSGEVLTKSGLINMKSGKRLHSFPGDYLGIIGSRTFYSEEGTLFSFMSPWEQPLWSTEIVPADTLGRIEGVTRIDTSAIACWAQDGKVHIIDMASGAALGTLDHWSADDLEQLKRDYRKRREEIDDQRADKFVNNARDRKRVISVIAVPDNRLLTTTVDGYISLWDLGVGVIIKAALLADGFVWLTAGFGGNSVIACSGRGNRCVVHMVDVFSLISHQLIPSFDWGYVEKIRVCGEHHIVVYGDYFRRLVSIDDGNILWSEAGWLDHPRNSRPVVLLSAPAGDKSAGEPIVAYWHGEMAAAECLGTWKDTVVYKCGVEIEYLKLRSPSSAIVVCGL